MEKNVIISILYSYYGKLLTDKQAEAIDLYYNEDLSLTEIADLQGVSKQSVSETIKRSEKILLDYENKLALVAKLNSLQDYIYKLEEKLINDLGDDQYSDYMELIFQIKQELK